MKTDEWYALFKKGDDLLAMKDAYNRGMMGQLDGEKAQTAEEQVEAAATTGGGRSAGLDAKDEDDGESQEDSIKPYPWSAGEEGEKPENTIEPYPWSPDEKNAEKQAAIAELDDQMSEEIALANGLREDTYQRAYDYFDENIDLQDIKEGNYIEAELIHNVIDDERGDIQELGDKGSTILIQKVRFYDAGGVYVYDQKNALNNLTSVTIGGY